MDQNCRSRSRWCRGFYEKLFARSRYLNSGISCGMTDLSILTAYRNLKTHQYYCDQFDFPLRVLSWFPKALEEFRKPAAAGGLHAGAMTSADENVDGEMLCVQAATQGYHLVNRSRQSPLDVGSSYMPTRISFSYHFLYDLGFLDLLKKLGE
ncbi:hypothetical protein [Vibrio vulnificus]|uniref:hypothetical protein n=1 Tax=Vibrio vulnificus TaxID=672 RepID=UPI004057D0E9